ncbi:MAG: ATP-binding cassette domain-containing protein, partial [Pygmaiobacter sp.]
MESDKLIEVKGLVKNFGKLEVLKEINTEIKRGEVVAIIGPSGSGKSTFLRCLNLLEAPSGGEIIFEGVNICDKKTDINLHRQKIGMVFQQFNLFNNMTVLRNVAAAPIKIKGMSKEQAEAKALELLDSVGLRDKADSYPSQ